MKKLIYLLAIPFLFLFVSCGDDEHPHDQIQMASSVVTVDWYQGGSTDYPIWTSGIAWPSITSEVLNNGLIMVYGQAPTGGWVMLPFTFVWGGYESSILITVGVGEIVLEWVDSDLIQPDYPFVETFRVVVIENKYLLPVDIDLKNIEELEKYAKH